MAQFIFFYRASPEAMQRMGNATPEQQQAHMGKWQEWVQSNMDALQNPGTPVSDGKVLTATEDSEVDGTLMGYAVLEAADMAAAEAILKTDPFLGQGEGCAIEVYECMQMPG
jgi:hypothetical protein